MTPPADSLRIDRWLFYCRFFKTRSLATAAVGGGHVRLNGERTTPGSRIKCGEDPASVRYAPDTSRSLDMILRGRL